MAGNEANPSRRKRKSSQLFVERVGLNFGPASFDGFVKPGILVRIGVALVAHKFLEIFRLGFRSMRLDVLRTRLNLFRPGLLLQLAKIKINLTYRMFVCGLSLEWVVDVAWACFKRLDVEGKFFHVTHLWRLLV